MSGETVPSALGAIGRLADNPGFLAARFSWFAARTANTALEPFDLSTRTYSILELASVGDGMNQRDIARVLRLDPSAIVGIVDALSDRGLVVRQQDARDRRRTLVRATDAGGALAVEAAAAVTLAYDTMLQSLSEDERAVVDDVLRRVALLPESDIPGC